MMLLLSNICRIPHIKLKTYPEPLNHDIKMCIFVICDKHRLTLYTYVNLLLHQTLNFFMSTVIY
jgi:hypothetical protein